MNLQVHLDVLIKRRDRFARDSYHFLNIYSQHEELKNVVNHRLSGVSTHCLPNDLKWFYLARVLKARTASKNLLTILYNQTNLINNDS